MEKQLNNDPDQSLVLVNLDVLNTILLSFHPASKIEELDLSDHTREGLAELVQLQDLIHMDIIKGYDGYDHRLISSIYMTLKMIFCILRSEGAHGGYHKDMPKWLANIPSNYAAQMALMGWFLTLTSKMTGFTIPEYLQDVPGGTIEHSRDAIAHYLHDMETIADAMAVEKYWDRPQYVILKKMHLDLKTMHFSFCLMEVSTGPRFLAARDNKRDF